VGTPLYMSPEQAHGAKSADWRADVYGLGATLYHLVTGFTPFDAKLRAMALMFKHAQEDPPPAHTRNTEVSLQVSQLIGRMMQKKCEDRHGSPDELLADIEQAKQNLSFEFASG